MKKGLRRFGVVTLALILLINSCAGAFAATTSDEITQREVNNSEFAYYAATQGMVLLENNGALPIAKEGKVALFGAGVRHTVKGGTGSGDVNQRAIVTVEQGFENAGYTVTSDAYLDAFDVKWDESPHSGGMSAPPPVDDLDDIDAYIEEAKGADWAFYVISRNSGEFADRTNSKLDYELSDNELANITKISAAFEKTVIILNVGGVMDTKFFKQVEGLDAMLLMSQAGMRGGDAVVAVLNGTVNPSGKLTDTWPVNYSDYACAEYFGANDDDVNHEYYKDDIYVGYRYFDTFGVDVAYPFGYGGSYTTFATEINDVALNGTNVAVTATVTNTGDVAGKEVVEVYFSAPDGALEKPYQELAAYGKTKELEPGKSQTLRISYPLTEMSSYSMEKAAYILEKGDYIIRAGNSSRNTAVGGVLTLAEDVITEQLSNQMVQDEEMDVLSKAGATPITYEGEQAQIAAAKRIAIDPEAIVTENNASEYDAEEIKSYVYPGSEYVKAEGTRYTKGNTNNGNPTVQPVKVFDAAEGKEEIVELERPEGLEAGAYTLRDVATGKITMTQFVADLSVEEMAYIVEGIGWGGSSSPIIGAQSNSVQGAAGETTARYYETRLIPNTVLADGPAGIRITQHYTRQQGQGEEATTVDYYQFASAFPIGTLIAMTWDPEVIQEFGNRIGEEMTEFGVTLWLAPGMNIHRNALCGRNFEYYSEDPLIAGMTAGYTTLGVQSHAGIGVTLKHYAGNNQENNRNAVNNTITERALREIYLKGFETAIKMAQPMAIMTSYNQNNSMPAADDYDMCTDLARGEWGFKGLIMTDWGGGQSTPVNSMHAGNDLIMPGGSSQNIINQFTTARPTFDENTGYVVITGNGWRRQEQWGEFVLAADGTETESVTVAADVDLAGNQNIQQRVTAGTASITENEDGTKTVTYKGNYAPNALPLGDLQKSAANVLNIIMQSTQFGKITREYPGDIVTIRSYTRQFNNQLKSYVTKETVELPSEREKANSEFSCYAATQGMALLENSGGLPIAKEGKVALFGAGVRKTVKGGTGSGAVNQRDTVNVEQGFENAGYTVTTKDYLDAYDAKAGTGGGGGGMWGNNRTTDDLDDIDGYIESAKAAGSDYALYFVARNSGEGSDRSSGKLDYELSDNERGNIAKIAAAFDTTIVVLNTGGVMDTKFYKEIEGLDAMLLMSQPGMRGGDAVVQVLNGDVNPSGKLTDTWPVNYSDYPSAETFANNDNNNRHEIYTDDIYVGYRYFDTFGKEVAYPFGYGGSYTTFDIKLGKTRIENGEVAVVATVKNTGAVAGKEVVEVYFSAPDGALEKPYQELAAFAKTQELEPGASQSMKISFPITEMSSYSMEKAAYIMEKGEYIIRVGNSSRNTAVAAVLTLAEDRITEQLSNQMVQDEEIELLSKADATPITYEGEAEQIAAADRIAIETGEIVTENNASPYDGEEITSYVYPGSDYVKAVGERYTKGPSGNPTVQAIKVFDAAEGKETIEELARPEGLEPGKYTLRDVATGKITMTQFVADLSVDEMAHIVEGISGASNPDPVVGAQANSVRGAAGETTSLYYDSRLIPNTVLADGPAGVRITQHYTQDGEDYFQYCTAFPIGTLIAMTWDPEVIEEFGNRIGQEMSEYGVTLWLAPGMNIHRNALCGRNFEYYSEDPLIAGITAGYTTKGVQSHPGIGVTLKHYAVNSQETSRNSENNTVTERALREIYLKGFEIGVKMAQPMAIMTSYNQNNSMPAADDYDMCTDLARGEWGFKGLIMTDWGGGQSTPVNSMHAGNDLIMPGGSTASIINMFRDVPPTFDETTGYVVRTGGRRPVESWGTFVLAADGSLEMSVTVAADVDVEGNQNISSKVTAGTAVITVNEDGTKTVTYKGDYAPNALPLGDLQKSAAHVLNIVMQSSQFEKITKEYEGEQIIAAPYTEKFADELKTFITVGEAPEEPEPADEYVLATEIVPGKTYVIVADGAYAMNNVATGFGGNYSGDSLGSTAVTIEGDKITSAVDETMLWTIENSAGVPDSRDGAPTYFIFDQAGQQLIRRSGRTGTAPLSVGTMNPASPQYAMFSFYQRTDGSYTLYVNSHQANDYNFTLHGTEGGFDAPGVALANWDGETYQSSIRLYEKYEPQLEDIDFSEPADNEKYAIVGATEGGCEQTADGRVIKATRNAVEPCNGQNSGDNANTPEDLIEVPVFGDWTATLKFNFAQAGARGWYSFFGFYAAEGEDYQNMAGIRGGDGAMQNFLRVDGEVTADSADLNSAPGLSADGDYWFRIKKEGTTYTCYRSADGAEFTEMFSYADTGIEATKLVIDAYTGMAAGYTYTLDTLKFGEEEVPPVPVDRTALEQAIAAAEAVDKDLYTDETVAALDEALAAAKAVPEDADQAAVDAAAEALNAAIDALEAKPVVDRTALEQAIADAEAVDKDLYTDETVAALDEALAAAKAVPEDADQAAVDAAAEALNAAIDALEAKPVVDKTALEEAIAAAEAEAATVDVYTPESLAALNEALEAAKAVQENPDATQDEVDAAAEALNAAVEALEVDDVHAYLEKLAKDAQALAEEAKAAAEAAQAAADAASQSAAEDKEAAEAAQAAAEAAQAKAEAAQKAAEDAKAAAEAADADAAAQAVEAAAQAAEAAKQAAEAAKAQAAAQAAQEKAEEAQAAAEAAQAKAEAAEAAAGADKAAAAAAQKAAEAAQKQAEAAQKAAEAAKQAADASNAAAAEAAAQAAEDAAKVAKALENAAELVAKAAQDKEAAEKAQEAAEKAREEAEAAALAAEKTNAKTMAAIAAMGVDPETLSDAELDKLDKIVEDAMAAIDAAEDSEGVQKALEDAVKALEELAGAEQPFRFDDVQDESKFYFEPVYWAYEAEPQITNGKTANLYGPDDGCTRGQVVTFLWRAAGCPEPKSADTPFTDLKEGAFYLKAVAWAVENEITNGTSETTFSPDDTCTRGQIVTFLWRFAGQEEPKSTQTAFTDVPATAFYAKAVAWAVENEVTNGMTPTTFVPGNTCTRGQVVTFLYRAAAE